jgi:Holliday junction resolvasome RuvABC endonuclease subunit
VWVAPYDWRLQLGVGHNAPKKVVRAAVAQRFDDVGGKSEHEVDAIAIALRAANMERVRLGVGRMF